MYIYTHIAYIYKVPMYVFVLSSFQLFATS